MTPLQRSTGPAPLTAPAGDPAPSPPPATAGSLLPDPGAAARATASPEAALAMLFADIAQTDAESREAARDAAQASAKAHTAKRLAELESSATSTFLGGMASSFASVGEATLGAVGGLAKLKAAEGLDRASSAALAAPKDAALQLQKESASHHFEVLRAKADVLDAAGKGLGATGKGTEAVFGFAASRAQVASQREEAAEREARASADAAAEDAKAFGAFAERALAIAKRLEEEKNLALRAAMGRA